MAERMFSDRQRGRMFLLPFAGLIAALAILCLALLVSAQSPPIRAAKTASPDIVFHGDTLQYTVVFTNDTSSPVNLVRITDTLPSGFVYLSLGSSSDIVGDPDGTAGTIVWNGPFSVPGNGTLRLIYNAKANTSPSSTPFDNQAEALLETDDQVSASASVSVVGVNMTGSKTVNQSSAPRGGMVTYKVTFNNNGTAIANVSAITDTLPASFAFQGMVSGSLPNPTVQAGNKLVWAGPIGIGAGDTLEFTYRATVDGNINQAYSNSVRASLNGETVGPYQANVTVTKPRVYLPVLNNTIPAPVAVYRLAYDAKPTDNFDVFAIDADGTNLVNVSNQPNGDLDPTWSPDGTRLAWVHFYGGKGDILVASADGSNQTNVSSSSKEDRAPAWSPDGSKIAFASYRDNRWEIYTVSPDGSGLTRITYNSCQSHDPVWSPDSTKIAYVCGLDENEEVYIANPDGSNPVRLTKNDVPDEALDWSPDSTRIAYVRYDGRAKKDSEIWIANVNTVSNSKLLSTGYADYSPAWSPDGTKIAFSTFLDGSYEIVVVNADGSNLVNLTRTAKADYVPRWSPDGTKIAFISYRNDADKSLYVMDANGANQVRLAYIADQSDTAQHIPEWKPR
jgi:uncharacterized repeat protein (TIGR01451 family)